jgi:hypothetical protein
VIQGGGMYLFFGIDFMKEPANLNYLSLNYIL